MSERRAPPDDTTSTADDATSAADDEPSTADGSPSTVDDAASTVDDVASTTDPASTVDEPASTPADRPSTVQDPVDRYAVSPDASETEFLAAAKLYARAVADRHDLAASIPDLEWSVSKRAKRRAGVVKYRDGDPEEVVLTWDHFVEHGWEAAAGTIRHELVHVHLLNEASDASHGEAFERLAERIDAPVHCQRFTDPDWWVICEDCEARIARYRRSKLVQQPEDYRCSDCGGDFRVVDNGATDD